MKSLLTFALLLVLAPVSRASQVYTEAPPLDPLETSDLVIRGVVESLATQWTDPWDPRARPERRTTVRISQVLRGRHVGPILGIIALHGRDLLVSGREYVICAFWSPPKHAYVTSEWTGVYGSDGHQWIRVLGRQFDIPDTLTDAELRERVSKGSLKAVTSRSDVIVTGRVVSISDSISPGDYPHGRRTKGYGLEVTETLKGSAGKEIQIVVPHLGSRYFNRTQELKSGQQWLVFLQKREFGWYLFAGPNSLFEIRGEKLIYNNEVICPRSRADLFHRIRRQVRLERL